MTRESNDTNVSLFTASFLFKKNFLENGSAVDGLCFLYKRQNYLQVRQCPSNVNIETRPLNHCAVEKQ